MNTLSKEHQLQKRISEILKPNLEDRLVYGATYLFDNRSNNVIVRANEDNIRFCDNGTISSNYIKPELAIGLPINLERLLLSISKIEDFNIPTIGIRYYNTYFEISVHILSSDTLKLFNYYLDKPFKEQYHETQEAIYKLFNIE